MKRKLYSCKHFLDEFRGYHGVVVHVVTNSGAGNLFGRVSRPGGLLIKFSVYSCTAVHCVVQLYIHVCTHSCTSVYEMKPA
jgi:hypothetical protein